MKTLKRIGLFVVRKVIEVSGGLLVLFIIHKFFLWLSAKEKVVTYFFGTALCFGLIMSVIGVIYLIIEFCRWNWEAVKRRIP